MSPAVRCKYGQLQEGEKEGGRERRERERERERREREIEMKGEREKESERKTEREGHQGKMIKKPTKTSFSPPSSFKKPLFHNNSLIQI